MLVLSQISEWWKEKKFYIERGSNEIFVNFTMTRKTGNDW
jgi:hypothetical protein